MADRLRVEIFFDEDELLGNEDDTSEVDVEASKEAFAEQLVAEVKEYYPMADVEVTELDNAPRSRIQVSGFPDLETECRDRWDIIDDLEIIGSDVYERMAWVVWGV